MGGYNLFVDYTGDTMPMLVGRLPGEVRQAKIFIAVAELSQLPSLFLVEDAQRPRLKLVGEPGDCKILAFVFGYVGTRGLACGIAR